MKKKQSWRSAEIPREQHEYIKGGYKHVAGAINALSFIGTAVDIRFEGDRETTDKNSFKL